MFGTSIMSGIKYISKDRRLRQQFWQSELSTKIKKSIFFNRHLPLAVRWKAFSFPPHLVRVRNRCIDTGRGRWIISDFGLGRHSMRKFMREGALPGLRKSSW